MTHADPFGFLAIDKPLMLTSHDVVAVVRRIAMTRQVGHAGTLDPLATGVLVVCVGAATRLSDYVMHTTKQYRATVRLGVTTTTYDAEGDIVRARDPAAVTRDQVAALLPAFTGMIDQVPPVYSAIKQGGKTAYARARAGETVELPARPVRIDSLTIADWQPPLLTLDVVCGAGTYIRSLAHDLGEALGVGGSLAGLIRTASGAFTIERAVPLADLTPATLHAHLIDARTGLAHLPALTIDAGSAQRLRHGQRVDVPDAPSNLPDEGIVIAYDADDRLVAILAPAGGQWRPLKVFDMGAADRQETDLD